MTERRPPGTSFETWVDRQIREAEERGEFHDLPGAGKPLPDLTGTYDELWWVKKLMAREQLSYLPPALALQREAERIREGLPGVRSEAALRRLVERHNARVAEAIRVPPPGPPVQRMPMDVDAVVRTWREQRARDAHAAAQTPMAAPTAAPMAAPSPEPARAGRRGRRRRIRLRRGR